MTDATDGAEAALLPLLLCAAVVVLSLIVPVIVLELFSSARVNGLVRCAAPLNKSTVLPMQRKWYIYKKRVDDSHDSKHGNNVTSFDADNAGEAVTISSQCCSRLWSACNNFVGRLGNALA